MSTAVPPRSSPQLPARRMAPSALELAEIQGNLLRGYSHPSAAYVFVRVDDATGGRGWLGGLVDHVTTAEPWADTPETTLNLSFTWRGLAALGVDQPILDSFPEEFREGMAARAELLGDRGPSAPDQWEPGFGTGEAHVLVSLHASGPQALDQRAGWLLDGITGSGGAVDVVHVTPAANLPDGRDHFGFSDGIGRPAVQGSGVEPRPGDGLPEKGGGWRSIRPGEFLLGHEDEDGGLPQAPAPPFDRNASFEIYRQQYMDVARFRSFVTDAARHYPGGPELLAAKIVGRWRDGTPLVLSPDRPDPAIAGDPERVNAFRYEDDRQGLRCPLGAHIRRTNPRDDDGFFGGLLSNRHRIIRRGRPYGPPLPEGVTEDDGEDRGLVFRCFNASIARQFETIQSLWVDDGDGLHQGDDKDFMIGDATTSSKMTIPGNPPYFLSPQPMFTVVRAGEYLCQPSVPALRWLAEP
ncbi:MAG: Dyp-type peroxidase [Actinomycetota bacterium]|nr:Dyp-type peroxidase [Actinomycetota bacterium]